MRKRSLFLFLLVLAGAEIALAQTLYKLIDKNGKVTYSEKAPKDFDGKVIPMNIDPKANTATLPKYEAPKEAPGAAAAESRVAKAKANLEAALKTLASARENPGEEDVARVGNVKGGARPVPTEAYTARLAKLEEAVKEAERELREAEKSGS